MRPTVPILILSGSTNKPDDLGGANHFMHKTEGPEALIEIAHRLEHFSFYCIAYPQ
jgi:hypothetical protein